MVCPNCKHEINPQARVCPTCGTPIPGAPPAPTVVVQPVTNGAPPVSPAPRKKKKVTAARVFAVILLVLAVVMNGALVAFWFWPSITVTGGVAEGSANSVTLISMYDITWRAAPWLTIAVCVLCGLSAIFCIVPLFRGQSIKRKRLIIPKLAAILCALGYAIPYLVSSISYKINALLQGGDVSHNNPFTTICFWLFVAVCIAADLTVHHMDVIQRRQIQDLKDQLTAHGIQPEEW